MTYRVLYWLGVSMALGFRAAKLLIAMASSERLRVLFSKQAPHAVRYMHDGALERVSNGQPTKQSTARPSRVERLPAPGDVSDRIKTVDLYQGKLHLGVMWLYLYPHKKIARRVLKVHDSHLARALGRDRYYLQDVPFHDQLALDSIFGEFHKEVSKLLDRRAVQADKKRSRERQKEASAEGTPVVKASVLPVPTQAERKPTVVPPDVPKAVPEQPDTTRVEPAPAKPDSHRHVKGEAIEGTVTIARFTNKTSSEGGAYKTFCLTIHDGVREIPYFGAELQRHVSDLGIEPGQRIRVVYMGKQKVSQDGEPSRYKNLYQVTRLDA